MKYVLVFCIFGITLILMERRVDRAYIDGVRQGVRTALNTNPASEELELTCAGLWIGEQNKKQFQKGL